MFMQKTPYSINTSSGPRLRYAIGIRDVEFHAMKYEPKGELISLPFPFDREVQKVSLLASENPIEASELADIKHQISFDDGATWHDIQPQDRDGTVIPEILNVNTSDSDAIQTADAVYALRHRMVLSRDADKFEEGSSALKHRVEKAVDVLSIPNQSPLKLTLSKPPVAGTVTIVNPLWGSRDTDSPAPDEREGSKHILGLSNGQDVKFRIPLDLMAHNIDRDDVEVYVDDVMWKRVGAFHEDVADPWYESGSIYLSPTSKVYTLDRNGNLRFAGWDDESFLEGTDSVQLGQVPPAGAVVSFKLAPEYLNPSSEEPHIAVLEFPTDGERKHVRILRGGTTESSATAYGDGAIKIRGGRTYWQLPHTYIDKESVEFYGGGSYLLGQSDRVDFVDGEIEFTLEPAKHWSVDEPKGVLYINPSNPLPLDYEVSLQYDYVPLVELADDEWDFVQSADGAYDRVEIKPSAYAEMPWSVALDAGNDGDRVIDLQPPTGYVVAKSVKLPGSILEDIAGAGSDPLPHEVVFVDGVTEFKQVASDINTDGYYSVDYKNGLVYLAGKLQLSGSYSLEYRTTYLIIAYDIAKPVEAENFTVDTVTKTVEIDDSETLRIWGTRDAAIKRESLVKVMYDYVASTRESIKELEPYFTPIVRDVAVKILPKGGSV
jgi:hypothetical protein